MIYYVEGTTIGAHKIHFAVPPVALMLCVMLMAPEGDFLEYLGTREGRDAVRALTIAMNAT